MIKKIHHKFILNNIFNKPLGIIYMLHRIDDFDIKKLYPNENMKISPGFLEKFIIDKKEKYDFISIDDLLRLLQKKKKLNKPFIIFTLDDGYKDNFYKAFPIFKKFNVPFTLYITTGFPDKSALLWWYILEDIIINNKNVVLSTGEIFDCDSTEKKNEAFIKLRNIILDLPPKNLRQSFLRLFSGYSFNMEKYINELALTWDEIIEMSRNPLCTIGAHSVSHRKMSFLEYDEITNEIKESRKRIEEQTGKGVYHFAYPFGTKHEINSVVIDLVSNSGFHTSTIAGGGEIRKFGTNPYYLQRVMLTEQK